MVKRLLSRKSSISNKKVLTSYPYYLIILVGNTPNHSDGVGVVLNNFVKHKYIMTSKNDKKSFVFYDSFLSVMKHLNDAEFRECVLKIRDYALEDVDEESSSPMVNVIMAMAKPNLDSAKRRYMASVENGKKGAEYGKLGGAPKGNQNARKKHPLIQPQIQPLDEDVNEDVEEDVNKEVKVNGDDDGDNPSGSIGFQEEEIENDSERLDEREESNERNLGFDFKGFEFVAASEPEKEIHINSKSESNNTPPVSPCSEKEAGCSAARPSHSEVKEGAYDQSEYYRHCLNNYVLDLADMRKGILPNDGKLFWQAVKLYQSLRGCSEQQAVSVISSKVSEIAQRDN